MKTGGVFSSLLLLIALTSACGESDSGTGGTGGAGGAGAGGTGTGGKSGGGSGGTGAVDPGGPLLDRPPGTKYSCSISRPITRLNLPWNGFSLVPTGAGAELAVVSSDRNNPDPNRPGNSITWSTLGLDGTLGAPNVLRAPTNQYLPSVTAANGGEKSTIVWNEASSDFSSYTLNSLQVDAAGAVVTPKSILATVRRSDPVKLAKAASGYTLLWVDGDESSAKLTVGLLDESGKLASTPVVLAQGTYLSIGSIAPIGDHFMVSYADYQQQNSGLVARLLMLGADGKPSGEPIALESSSATGFVGTVPNLLVRGDQVLAAWSILTGDSSYEKQEAATTVRIARFDESGERQGLMYDLQAPIEDRESVQPFWVEVGDDIGLLWSDGSVIYLCGGCVPNHSLKFVVLDGKDFTPRSNVVELANTLPSGGLLSAAAARTGDDLLIVSSVTYHTSAEGASATIRCTQ